MRRASAILQTATCNHRSRNASCQVLGIEIREEGIHLLIGHATLVGFGRFGRPRHDIEVIWEVTEESHAWSDSGKRIIAECSHSIRECTTLTTTLCKELGHIAGLTGCHKANGLYAVHEGATIVVAILHAKVIREPVAVNVLEVFLAIWIAVTCATVVEHLSTDGEEELCILAVVTTWTWRPRGSVLRIIAIEVHDDRVLLTVLWLCVVTTHNDRVAIWRVGYGLQFYEVDFAFVGTLLLQLGELGVHLNGSQLLFGSIPIRIEVRLLVWCRNDGGRIDTKNEVTRSFFIHEAVGTIETGGQVFRSGYHNIL